MKWNEYSNLEGKHAILSASQSAWINDNVEDLTNRYKSLKAKEEGTILHDFASQAINLRVKLAKSKRSLNMFVNDAIGYRMKSEQILYYSEYCFGTADAIAFEQTQDGSILRIFDLKTGKVPAKFRQLNVYAALFCLEYSKDPFDIDEIELRIYQGGEVIVENPDKELISDIMKKIVDADKVLRRLEARR